MSDRVTKRSRGETVKHDHIPEAVRERFLELLKTDRNRGNVSTLVQAFRDSGDYVFKGEIAHLVDADLKDDAREARGWTLEPIVANLHAMAVDPKSPHAVRAATLFLNGPHGEPGWRDQSRLELTGADGAPVAFEDRSASLNDVADVLTATGALNRSNDDRDPVAATEEPVAAPGDV